MPSSTKVTPSPSLENCDAVIVALRSRRYVVVYRDRPVLIWPFDRVCQSIRTLKPGDRVRYKGRMETIEAMQVY